MRIEVWNARGKHDFFKLAPEFRDGMEFFADRDGLFDLSIKHVAVAQDRLNALKKDTRVTIGSIGVGLLEIRLVFHRDREKFK